MSKISISLGVLVFFIVFIFLYTITDSAFALSESTLSDPNLKTLPVIFHFGLSVIAGLVCGGLVERRLHDISE